MSTAMKGRHKVILSFLLLAASTAMGGNGIDIGSRWELFVDSYLIQDMQGDIALHLHRPTPREVVLVHDKPWEGNTCGYHTIFQDGDLFRMYYRGWGHEDKTEKQLHPALVCYAESRDGIRWTRPNLGLVEFNGSKENNIVWAGTGTHNFVPFKDANPACPPEARYKAVARGEDEYHTSLLAFQSPDGIHWKLMQPTPIITEGAFDSQNLAFWDSVTGRYRCYFRDFRDGVRDIKTASSKDFIHWTKPVWLDYPGAPKQHLYTNQIQPYCRAPHLYLGFPTRYLPDRESLTEGLFMSSRDGIVFHRWSEAIIPPGRNRDKWHNRSNYIWLGMVETQSDLPGAGKELSLYSNERYYEGAGGKIRRYTCRIDGFVSLRAGFTGGRVITKPLLFAGDVLRMNFSTSAAGSVQVEIQDINGKAVPGFGLADCPEMYGDAIEKEVAWKSGGDVGTLAGRPIRIHFILRDADVFAFGFGKRP
ncbi:MAG: hypothetical protein JW828_16955 [Sedimentisphaerales bacterium]|nr:hypothetical protein [Sedimentisphaerales bacterium]